jgi:tetratricopeptide (TPR) repeat protein
MNVIFRLLAWVLGAMSLIGFWQNYQLLMGKPDPSIDPRLPLYDPEVIGMLTAPVFTLILAIAFGRRSVVSVEKRASLRPLFLLLVLVLVVWALDPSPGLSSPNRSKTPAFAVQLLEEAAKSGSEGDFKKSVDITSRVISLDADNAVAYLIRGTSLRKMGDYPQALADFDRAIRISPRSAEAYCQRAFAHQQSRAEGSMEKAFADVSQAIELNRSMPLAYILRGSAYSDRGEFSAAVADFSRAIELNSRSYSGYGGRAAAYAGLGDFAKARRDVEKAMSLNPPQNDLKPLIRFRDSLPDQPR